MPKTNIWARSIRTIKNGIGYLRYNWALYQWENNEIPEDDITDIGPYAGMTRTSAIRKRLACKPKLSDYVK